MFSSDLFDLTENSMLKKFTVKILGNGENMQSSGDTASSGQVKVKYQKSLGGSATSFSRSRKYMKEIPKMLPSNLISEWVSFCLPAGRNIINLYLFTVAAHCRNPILPR